jgi:hypothetical protein
MVLGAIRAANMTTKQRARQLMETHDISTGVYASSEIG